MAMGVALYGSTEGCRQDREGGLELGSYMVLAMSEEQLKAAETEATAEQEEEFGEEISEDDLEGVAGGLNHGLLESGAGISPAR